MICLKGIVRGRIVLVATVLAAGASAAQAATPLYWPGDEDGYGRPLYDTPYDQPRRRVVRQPRMPKEEAARAEQAAKGGRKPTGPLVMAISIERQTMKVYDANGFFAETPISSGVKDHSTPMGVFSVIQKNKWHRSNLYSDAPMPFMQRLTWSGIALHAGVVPGHPASHGCVRMPMSFAVKMWSWTRMGARVVIVPGEISPESFSHPLLASIKPAPAVPVASAPALAVAQTTVQPVTTVLVAAPAANTRTADASQMLPAKTASDATANTPAPSDELKGTVTASEKPGTVVTDQPVAEQATTQKMAVDKPPATETTAKRTGPIAIFISRKDAKLYVRQNFAPLFDVPVTISGDQPFGTHVFTAYADKDASRPVQWTVLSLPASARMTEEPAPSRRRQSASAVVTAPLVMDATATEALDRLKLPDDVLARLGENLKAGSSLVISDQGLTASGETGAGTDFIVRLR